MGLTAVVSSSSQASGTLSLLSGLGVGVGGIFVTALLVYLLGYLNIVEASERRRRGLHALLVATTIPLAIVFAAIITFQSLSIVGLL